MNGYVNAGSKTKYLRFITGRHDIPFYYDQEVEVQRSFLDAFLKGEDRVGWSVPGKVPAVDMVIRKGSPGYNDAAAELAAFPRRTESEWPPARTQYQKWYLDEQKNLTTEPAKESSVLRYEAPTYVVPCSAY